MTAPFVILGLPRSRTFWLSRFLSYGDWHCGHDELRHCRTLDDVKAWLSQPCTGTVETAAAPFWRLLPHLAPEARVVTIRRPVDEVVDSLARCGMPVARETVEHWDHKLDQVERRIPGTLRVRFDDLEWEDTCAALFRHCLPYAHDHAWWTGLSDKRLTYPVGTQLRHAAAYIAQHKRLASMARQACLMRMQTGHRPDVAGLTFQQETLADFIRDGQALFAEHALSVGEEADSWQRKNISLMETLEKIGALKITTARINGRMYGYLWTIVFSSLEARDMISAQNSLFYASPQVPGLGLKLGRAALQSAKAAGVKEGFARSGIRGDGDRSDVLWRRLGYEDFGRMHRIDLEAA